VCTYFNVNHYFHIEKGKGEKLILIFISKADRKNHHNIGKTTKAQIETIILKCMKQIRQNGDSDAADILEDTWERERLKTAKKDALLSFYK